MAQSIKNHHNPSTSPDITLRDLVLNDDLLRAIKALGASCAIWRMPGETGIHAIVDFASEEESEYFALNNSDPGFVFGRFKQEEDLCAHVLHPHLHFYWADSASVNYQPEYLPKVEELLEIVRNGSPEFNTSQAPNMNERGEPSPQEGVLVGAISKAVDAIQSGLYQKVVLADYEDFKIPSCFSLVNAFHSVCAAHPAAFASLVLLSDRSVWIGASPEILVSLNEDAIFNTAAVAGTQEASAGCETRDVVWRQKEIEEQALVSRFIVDQFKKIRLREFDEEGPRTVKAGNLFHLKTDFMVNTRHLQFPDLHSTMLTLLHPTSAVCGMPKESAMSFIDEHERFDREFYAGFLGPVNINKRTDVFVNLRCARISQHTIRVYAGAGITYDSDPRLEAEEIATKLESISSPLFKGQND